MNVVFFPCTLSSNISCYRCHRNDEKSLQAGSLPFVVGDPHPVVTQASNKITMQFSVSQGRHLLVSQG